MENGKIAETTALVDSRATICYINLHFTQRMGWPLERLENPICARNADGTTNKEGMIRYQIDLHLQINKRNTIQCFFVMDLGKKNNIILWHPWLTKCNPIINWTAGMVKLRGTPIPRHDKPEVLEQRYLLRYLHTMGWDNSELAAQIYIGRRSSSHQKAHPFHGPSSSC